MVARSEYVSLLLAVAAAKITVTSTVSSAFCSRVFSEVYMRLADYGCVSCQVQFSLAKKSLKLAQLLLDDSFAFQRQEELVK